MSPSLFACRRLAAAALVACAGFGLAAVTAAPAAAATPAASTSAAAAERVIRDQAGKNTILVPDRIAGDSGVRSRPRTGVSNETPANETWQTPSAPGGGGITLVAGPSATGGRPLCLDVPGDSTKPGTALVLRPCDGSDSQTWRALSLSSFTQYENKLTKLKMEVVGGRLVQNEFPVRGDADFRERTRLQGFSIVPKSFGVGGA